MSEYSIEIDKDSKQIPNGLEHKITIMNINNGWNDKNENIVISIGENSASYKWMHEKCSTYYSMVNRVLGIVMIVFSTGLSAESIIPKNSTNDSMEILRRVFTYIVTFLSVLQNFLKYEQLSEKHHTISNAYSQLYHNIQQQMCMYRRDRHNATIYVSDILKQYDSLVVKGPSLENVIIKRFKSIFKDSNISIPDIVDRIQKIEIIPEQNLTAAASTTSEHCNLQNIHNVFKIHGDISDKDLEQTSETELKILREKYFREKRMFEYNRYIQHNTETD